ncbi:MAG: hypothetical protein DCF15_08535 [Phormidesmis priestleyi]|uniref:Uncharacterized protein n=1 Tax=Phormidesmis priestleyi TaxID=268141 RepID=A0A2W4ZE74_9CYAN|nr:MAG: hypothetical protein DCF15_08535 [Phormidesmis priestleyi]
MNKVINAIKFTIRFTIRAWLPQGKTLSKSLFFTFSQVMTVWLLLVVLMPPSMTLASLMPPISPNNLVAYSVDYEMDKARAEKTVEHYGEPMRDIVEDALENNEENPNSKPTAQNTYQRESPLNDVLPKKIGDSFSQKELSDMQRDDK